MLSPFRQESLAGGFCFASVSVACNRNDVCNRPVVIQKLAPTISASGDPPVGHQQLFPKPLDRLYNPELCGSREGVQGLV